MPHRYYHCFLQALVLASWRHPEAPPSQNHHRLRSIRQLLSYYRHGFLVAVFPHRALLRCSPSWSHRHSRHHHRPRRRPLPPRPHLHRRWSAAARRRRTFAGRRGPTGAKRPRSAESSHQDPPSGTC